MTFYSHKLGRTWDTYMVAEQLSHVARLSKKPGNTGQSSGKHRTNRQGYPPEIKGGLLDSHFEAGWWFQPTPLKNDGVRQLG
jgi:hypothetical protein